MTATNGTADLARLESLADLGDLDVTDGDALLLRQREQLEKALAREDASVRDIVAVSAELRAVHEKLQDVANRRHVAWRSAQAKVKVAALTATLGAKPGPSK
jgi:hypothetical protein